MEDDHGAHLRIEPEKAAFELVAIDDRRLGSSTVGACEFGQLDVQAVAA